MREAVKGSGVTRSWLVCESRISISPQLPWHVCGEIQVRACPRAKPEQTDPRLTLLAKRAAKSKNR